MSISEDIKALEEALGEHPADGPWRLERHNAMPGDPASPGEDWTVYDANGGPLCYEGGMGSISSAFLIAACSPDRIRRVLAKLEFERGHRQMIEKAYEAQSARLSKAIELLKKGVDEGLYVDEVSAFLKEVSE